MNSEETIALVFLIALIIVVPTVLWLKSREEEDDYIGTKKRK